MRGHLIIVEGPDGVGKTTASEALVACWQSKGASVVYYAFPGRELGTLGHLVYRLHHGDPALNVNTVNPVSLQVLHIASHIDAIDRVIRPALEMGRHVVLDRYWWSTWVYGIQAGISMQTVEAMIAVERTHWSGVYPTATFLMTRASPLRVEMSRERWDELSFLYSKLGEQEKQSYPVVHLANEGTVGELVNDMMLKIEEIGSLVHP